MTRPIYLLAMMFTVTLLQTAPTRRRGKDRYGHDPRRALHDGQCDRDEPMNAPSHRVTLARLPDRPGRGQQSRLRGISQCQGLEGQ